MSKPLSATFIGYQEQPGPTGFTLPPPDPEVQKFLLEKHGPIIESLVRRYRRMMDPDDIRSVCKIALLDRAYVLPGAEEAVVYVALKHALIDALRDEMRHQLPEEEPDLDALECAEPTEEAAPDAEEALIKAEETKRLHEAVEELPEDEREVIRLLHFQGLPEGEVARLLSVTVRTVWNREQRAMAKLKEWMG